MINFALGLVIGSLFASSYFVVYNIGKKKKNTKLEDISSFDREKMKRLQEGFNNVMNYDINVAMGREDK